MTQFDRVMLALRLYWKAKDAAADALVAVLAAKIEAMAKK